MAEKIKINVSNGQKKSSDEQFLKASRNWQKCSALVHTIKMFFVYKGAIDISIIVFVSSSGLS
jgi:hypothetical protein